MADSRHIHIYWLQSIHWTLFWLEKHLDLLIHCKTLKYRWPWTWSISIYLLSFLLYLGFLTSQLSLFRMQSHYRDYKLKVLSLWSLTTNLYVQLVIHILFLCLWNLTADGLISLQKNISLTIYVDLRW